MPGSVHNSRKYSRSIRNECVDRMDTLDQDNGFKGHLDLLMDLRGIEVNPDCQKVFDNTDYGRICCGHREDQHTIKMDMQCQENGPGVYLGKQVRWEKLRGIGHDWKQWMWCK